MLFMIEWGLETSGGDETGVITLPIDSSEESPLPSVHLIDPPCPDQKTAQTPTPGISQREDDTSQGQTFYHLGKVHYDKSNLTKAKNYFEQALLHCKEGQEFFFEFKILGFLIRISSEQLDDKSIKQYVDRSAFITEKACNELGTLGSETLYNMGLVKVYQEKFEESFENLQLAVRKSKEDNLLEVLAKSHYVLATGYYQTREFEKALAHLGYLGDTLSILQKTYLEGAMNFLYGNIYSELGNYNTSLDYYSQATKALTSKTCWNLFGYLLLARGVSFKNMGKYDRSLWCFEMARETTNPSQFKRLDQFIQDEMNKLNDSNVDIYLDRKNRIAKEKTLGTVDFKHRFVLLEILFLLAKEPGVYYDKNRLTNLVWGDDYNPMIHDKLIYTSVSRLRKLIEPPGERRKYIIRGREGYAFNPHVNVRLLSSPPRYSHRSIDISSPV